MSESSNQFTKIKTPDGKIAYEGYMAVLRDGPVPHVAIVAPTLEALAYWWNRVAEIDLKSSSAQKVKISQ